MVAVKNELVNMIDHMAEPEQRLLFEIAKRFVADDIASADDLDAIREAREEYARGETISHEAINWD